MHPEYLVLELFLDPIPNLINFINSNQVLNTLSSSHYPPSEWRLIQYIYDSIFSVSVLHMELHWFTIQIYKNNNINKVILSGGQMNV